MQTTADELPEEDNISPVIGEASAPDTRIRSPVDQQNPTIDEDVRSMTVYEAEHQESYD